MFTGCTVHQNRPGVVYKYTTVTESCKRIEHRIVPIV